MTKDNSDEILNTLYDSVRDNGFLRTVASVFKRNVRVSIPLTKTTCDAPIDVIALSTRADNALRRSDVTTIGQLADLLNRNGLSQTRNIGTKTVCEIQTKLLAYLYEQLDRDEQRRFLWDLVQRNTRIHPITV